MLNSDREVFERAIMAARKRNVSLAAAEELARQALHRANQAEIQMALRLIRQAAATEKRAMADGLADPYQPIVDLLTEQAKKLRYRRRLSGPVAESPETGTDLGG